MESIPSNPILDRLPAHLKQYIIPQNYSEYTSINQAVWRYVMRKNITFLSKVAHHTYVDGLKKTGVSIEEIPDMYGMNRILKDIGWAAAAVDGFIPPSAFMEFQAYNVLVIAVDIRTLENIEYTHAPDIIHEAAGHAPIIANPEYAEYLRRLGEIGSKAISSKHDWEVYHAVRKLSQLKEVEEPDMEAIKAAQEEVDRLQALRVPPSEMSKIRNLQWWTVEYGLIGTTEKYKIYGAGLLSSIGESEWCLKPEVKKIPYTIDAADQEFDITRPQPQLFVTPNFSHLSKVLEEFANKLSLRKGGLAGLKKLVESESLGTIELSTGLQVSGVFTNYEEYEGQVALIKTMGPTALAYREKELIGHSTLHYTEGFISPIGKLKSINLAIEDMSPVDLEAYGIYEGKVVSLEYEGGIVVKGRVITGTRNLQGKILLITLENGNLTLNGKQLYTFQDDIFHMAIGKKIISAFAGPADHQSFSLLDHQLSPSTKSKNKSSVVRLKEEAYQSVRDFRQNGSVKSDLIDDYLQEYDSEWLLLLEILELLLMNKDATRVILTKEKLQSLSIRKPSIKHLIQSGIEMVEMKKEHPAH
ncbi:aromatic amino acid hydroxylase [Portibacter marinus]|uniref:aromatic amino acid hydroxylase n=1 Tax=Portibacter marinus TaxID=2898660 RepID=UPI001F2B0D9A|nr:aromatic amino acid hydroxylase [Portibacter marinus]